MTCRSQRFSLEIVFTKGCIADVKGKRYAIEVVITAEKLPLDDLEDVKDDLDEAQS